LSIFAIAINAAATPLDARSLEPKTDIQILRDGELDCKAFHYPTLYNVKKTRDPELIKVRGSTLATYVMLRGMQQKREKAVCRQKMQDRDPDLYQSYCQ
jgi:hypothetical protein